MSSKTTRSAAKREPITPEVTLYLATVDGRLVRRRYAVARLVSRSEAIEPINWRRLDEIFEDMAGEQEARQ